MDYGIDLLAVIQRGGKVWEVIKIAWDWVRILIPILIIVFSSIDFLMAITKEEEEMKKAQMRFIKRLIMGVAFFVIPAILNILFGWTSTWSTPIDKVNL